MYVTALPITLLIWFLNFLILTGWHERGHLLAAIKAKTLKKKTIHNNVLKDLERARRKLKDEIKHPFFKNFLYNITIPLRKALLYIKVGIEIVAFKVLEDRRLKAGAQKKQSLFMQLAFDVLIIFLGPLGLFPGITRKGLTYYVETANNLKVSAAGPAASLRLSITSGILTVGMLIIGTKFDIVLIIYIGRLFLGLAITGIVDFLLADPGKWKEYDEQERRAKVEKTAGEVGEIDTWESRMKAVKERMISSPMHKVLLPDSSKKESLGASWPSRCDIQGGVITEELFPESNISMQDIMFIPLCAKNYEGAQEITMKLHTRLKQIIESTENCRFYGISLEGGTVPYIQKEDSDTIPEERLLRMATQAISESELTPGEKLIPGEDVVLAINVNADKLQDHYRLKTDSPTAEGGYYFWREGGEETLGNETLLGIYIKLIEEDNVPIIAIQNAFAKEDIKDGWKPLMDKYGDRMFIIGDNMVPTKGSSIEEVTDKGLINTLTVRLNSIGTLSEGLFAALVAIGKGLELNIILPSETPNEDTEAQFSLALGAALLQAGGGFNTERLVQYGTVIKLMKALEEEAGDGKASKFIKDILTHT